MHKKTSMPFIISIVIILFLISVWIRLPNLNRPLGDHHEWLTANVIRVLQTWFDESPLSYNFNPVFTYSNPADRNIINQSTIFDKSGISYYTSYGQFPLMLPYFVFKVFSIYPTPQALQIFNLFLHLGCSLLVSGVIQLLTPQWKTSKIPIPALLGFCFYVFSPVTLWFHSNVYSFETFVQLPFLLVVFLVTKVVTRKNCSRWDLFGIGFFLFLSIYSEWLGVFLAFAIFLYGIFTFKNKISQRLVYTSVVSVIAGLTVMIWQYSLINGLYAYYKTSLFKFLIRSGNSIKPEIFNPRTWKTIYFQYDISYAGILKFVLLLVCMYFAIHLISKKTSFLRGVHYTPSGFSQNEKIIMFLSVLPVFLHHVIFINFTQIHDFSTLKSAVFFSLFIGLSADKILDFPWFSKKSLRITSLLLLLICLYSTYDEYIEYNDRIDTGFLDMGTTIAASASANDVVFIKLSDYYLIPPQLCLYAKRNVAIYFDDIKDPRVQELNLPSPENSIVDMAGAKRLLQKNGCSRGMLYEIKDNKFMIAGYIKT